MHSPFRHVATACGLAICATAAHAAYLPSASVRATGEGNLLGQRDGQTAEGNGQAGVNASTSYSLPAVEGSPFAGHFLAESSASVGSLKARASLDVGYLYTGASSLPVDAESRVEASFVDEWTFSGRPFDAIGTLRLTTTFHGDASVNAAGAQADTFGHYSLEVNSLEGFNNIHDSARFFSGPVRSANETVILELDFRYGRPVLLYGTLFASVRMSAQDYGEFSGSGLADFGNTAAITKLEVMGVDGKFSNAFELQTLSAGLYPFQSAVPEPQTWALVLAGLLVIGGRKNGHQ